MNIFFFFFWFHTGKLHRPGKFQSWIPSVSAASLENIQDDLNSSDDRRLDNKIQWPEDKEWILALEFERVHVSSGV